MTFSTRTAFTVLFLACASYTLSIFLRLFPTVLVEDFTIDLAINTAEVGLFSSTTMLAYGLMQLPSGLLADAFGGKRTIVWLGILAGLCTLVFAFSGDITVMTLSRVVTGFSIAVTIPALALLAHHFPAHMYARAASILLSCGGLGTILAAPPLIALSGAFGWQYALAFFAVLVLIVTFLIVILIPKDKAASDMNKVPVKDLWIGIKKVFSSLQFWPFALWQMFMSGTYFMLASLWWGPYITEGSGFSVTEVGIIMTVVAATIFIGQPVLGYFSDVVVRARKKPVLIISAIGMISSVAMVMYTGQMTFTMLIIQTVSLVIGIGLGSPLIFTMVKETFPLNLAGTASGSMNMLYPIWAAVMQTLFGIVYEYKLADSTPAEAMGAASWIVVANCAAAVIVCFLMKETFIGKQPEAT
ncbi:MAG: MFS transporter [Alphaproteobacteria bacterium]|nr:MFS transporter [Alphaproteobacteria bacterium]MCL2505300.1 MFS transporter [Alphaproteobacteria bacterium]